MARVDIIAHAVVSVVFLCAVTVLGVTGVLDSTAVVAMLVGGGTIVGALTTSDHFAYRNGKHVD